LGVYKLKPDSGFEAIPCDNDRFILITYGDLVDEKRKGLIRLVVASIPKGKKGILEIQIDSSISYGQEELLINFARTTILLINMPHYLGSVVNRV